MYTRPFLFSFLFFLLFLSSYSVVSNLFRSRYLVCYYALNKLSMYIRSFLLSFFSSPLFCFVSSSLIAPVSLFTTTTTNVVYFCAANIGKRTVLVITRLVDHHNPTKKNSTPFSFSVAVCVDAAVPSSPPPPSRPSSRMLPLLLLWGERTDRTYRDGEMDPL